MLCGDALGMELHAVDGQLFMPEAHNATIIGGGVDDQTVWNIVNNQRVIARGGVGGGIPAKTPLPS